MRKLNDAQIATLREMSSYKKYWFRQATCKTLVELGMAEKLRPDLKRSAHRITPAGRSALAQSEEKK